MGMLNQTILYKFINDSDTDYIEVFRNNEDYTKQKYARICIYNYVHTEFWDDTKEDHYIRYFGFVKE